MTEATPNPHASPAAPRGGTHWSFFLPRGADVTLIEIGAGRGESSALLAGGVGRVHALTFHSASAEEVTRRARELEIGNVDVASLTAEGGLPFVDRSVGAVVVDRVLNYPSLFASGRDPAGAVRHLLAEARRVLEPEGFLYAGVANATVRRWGVDSLLGYLRRSRPRRDLNFAANFAAAGRKATPEFFLTLSGYGQLLRAAGFRRVRPFAPLPDPVRPQVALPLDERGPQSYLFAQRIRRNSFKMNLAARLGGLAVGTGLLARVVPHYSLVARS